MIHKGNPQPHWKLMHCLPRKQEEVEDQVRILRNFFFEKKNLKNFQHLS
jgi:ornithine carbamoyltransferase